MAKINSRSKGKRGELELVHWLKDKGFDARRGQQYCGANGDADVICDQLTPFFHIECKRTERIQIYKALEQALCDSNTDQIPVVFHRQNNKPWVAILEAEHLITLIKLVLNANIDFFKEEVH